MAEIKGLVCNNDELKTELLSNRILRIHKPGTYTLVHGKHYERYQFNMCYGNGTYFRIWIILDDNLEVKSGNFNEISVQYLKDYFTLNNVPYDKVGHSSDPIECYVTGQTAYPFFILFCLRYKPAPDWTKQSCLPAMICLVGDITLEIGYKNSATALTKEDDFNEWDFRVGTNAVV